MSTVTLHPVPVSEFNPEDIWKVIANGPYLGTETLEIREILPAGEDWISGEALLARARELGQAASQSHAEQLLRQQSEIPEERHGKYLLFPGTIWQRGDSPDVAAIHCLEIPTLSYSGRTWFISSHCLDYRWRGYARLVRCCG